MPVRAVLHIRTPRHFQLLGLLFSVVTLEESEGHAMAHIKQISKLVYTGLYRLRKDTSETHNGRSILHCHVTQPTATAATLELREE